MNVFILDRDMEKSAAMLDDAHLKAQINEGCQILMANYNHNINPFAKVGHISHPVTKFYAGKEESKELLSYLFVLAGEYSLRFGKEHQNVFWLFGFKNLIPMYKFIEERKSFTFSKTLVDRVMTDDIDAIRRYISAKPRTKPLTWTNCEKPDWWEV